MINFIDKLKLPFRKDKELFSSLYDILGFYPHDIMLYKQALSHSSKALTEQNGHRLNNERLEFLGDAIIEAAVSDIIYRHFEKKREGFLTTTRSKLVQRDTLNKMAEEVGLTKLIRANGSTGSHNNNIGGNAFEAVVGAIYLDRGYKFCVWFLKRRIIAGHLNLDSVAKKEVNFKSKLLEWSQRNRLNIKFRSDLQAKDAATSDKPGFITTVVMEGVDCGKGSGFSKKESEQNAARETLVMLNRDKNKIPEILKGKEQRTAMEAELISVPPKVSEETPARPQRPRRKSSGPRRAQGERAQAETVASEREKALKQSVKAMAGNSELDVNEEKPQGRQQQPQANDGEGNAAPRRRPRNRRRPRRDKDASGREAEKINEASRDAIIAEAENKAFE